ncbi:sodium/potassium/calcium exchanger 3 isoform X2 [Acyrthosiphon pisum]|uniref:Sodium/calcium exchanger membrane region domain-containing protein n=1 Tax=Acyrthosiphon pisum TaxID=7029 RepID=A0A8R1X0Q1_ACYPI|nr:sodium/potassium/calcium exchanger 3 isoform X2 [Acyrthosiphon pisum]|eukprot:XP_008178917.1 PREDICTED: sodium/potassium/calcium exchanger 3 isoform X2 [Acyrthosiphon pisum]
MFRRLKSSITTIVLLLSVVTSSILVTPTNVAHSSSTSTTRPAVNHIDPGQDFTTDNFKNSSPTLCENIQRSIDEFPRDFFTEEQRRHGAVIVHLILAFYGFLFITFVCQDYFLPSVLYICLDLGISPDVAGATFMAAATCTSELLVSVIGTFVTKSDLGVGTVVGSGVYNTLGVSACAGLAVCGRPIAVEKWPLIRDSAVYATSIAVLAVIVMDNVIMWSEALIMVTMFFGYFIFLFTQHKLVEAVEKWKHNSGIPVFERIKQLIFCRKYASTESQNVTHYRGDTQIRQYGTVEHQLQEGERASSKILFTSTKTTFSERDQSDVDEQTYILPPSKSSGSNMLLIVWRMFCWPVNFALWATIPDCRTKRSLFPITFVMSIIWVSAITYVLSWFLTICGDTFHVSDVVMGIGVLAVGSSIPEAVSGIINAQNGEGSMSISSALGSNTMDILLCLGLPWFVKCTLPTSMNGGPVTLQTDTLFFNCMCMIASVVILNVAAAISGYKMHKPFGVMCLVAQMVVIAALIINGLNVARDDGTVYVVPVRCS